MTCPPQVRPLVLLGFVSVFVFSLAAAEGTTPPAPPPPPAAEAALPAAYFAEMAAVKRRFNQFVDACELYREAIARTEGESDRQTLELSLAECLEAADHIKEADALWAQLAGSKIPAVAYRAKLTLTSKLAAEGKLDEARAQLEEIAFHSPVQLYRDTAAKQLASLGGGTDKLAEYKARFAKDPRDTALLKLILALQENDPAGRAETLSVAYKADPKNLELIQRYGESLMEAHKDADAEAFFSGLLKDYPSMNLQASARLAELAMRAGDREKAAALALHAADRLPDDIEKYLFLTREHLELGLYEQAEHFGREADARAQGEAMKAAVAMELGEALFRLKKYEEALKVLRPVAEQALWRGLQTRAQKLVASIPTQSK